MDLLSRNFTAASVALATGGEVRKISDWGSRGLIVGQKAGGGIQGSNRIYSFSNVMEIGVAVAAIQHLMLDPKQAFELSRWFAHVGSSHSGHPSGKRPSDDPMRYPGLPFHHNFGTTYLIWTDGRGDVVLSEDGKLNVSGYAPNYSRNIGFMSLNVSEVFAQIMHRLALDYREVLDEAYSDQLKG